MKRCVLWLLAALLFGASGCGEEKAESKGPSPDRGRRLYAANCMVCHNADPSQQGSLGPAVMGASEALLRAKVLERRYPDGYVPKRNTANMPTYPHLKRYIPDLAAYLSNASG